MFFLSSCYCSVLFLICLAFHRGTAGNPARYNAESLDFFEETADPPMPSRLRVKLRRAMGSGVTGYADTTDEDYNRASRVGCFRLHGISTAR